MYLVHIHNAPLRTEMGNISVLNGVLWDRYWADAFWDMWNRSIAAAHQWHRLNIDQNNRSSKCLLRYRVHVHKFVTVPYSCVVIVGKLINATSQTAVKNLHSIFNHVTGSPGADAFLKPFPGVEHDALIEWNCHYLTLPWNGLLLLGELSWISCLIKFSIIFC